MILEDYRTSILDMTDSDAYDLIIELRRNRRISKKPVTVASNKVPIKQGELPLDNITPEMAAMLLAKLQERRKT